MRTCCIPHYHAATQEPEWTSLALAITLMSSTEFHQKGLRSHDSPASPRSQSSRAKMLLDHKLVPLLSDQIKLKFGNIVYQNILNGLNVWELLWKRLKHYSSSVVGRIFITDMISQVPTLLSNE